MHSKRKTQKTTKNKIKLAERRKQELLKGNEYEWFRKNISNMQLLDPEFSENYEGEYQAFKIGSLLKQANYLVGYLGVHIGVYREYNWL